MKRFIYFTLTICFLILWSSCRKDFEFTQSTGNLEFSSDTLFLDTIFTNIGSSTYNFKVYNRSDEDIVIPNVSLALGENSQYRLNVDGVAGKTFENVELLANDSIFIFVETTVDINNSGNDNTTFLYTDQVEFDTGANQQKVELVTLVNDAIFIFPGRNNATRVLDSLTINIAGMRVNPGLEGRALTSRELTLTNEKPYVFYGFAAVPPGRTLTVEAGARLHFHENSGIVVQAGASIQVNGALSSDPKLLENEVIFEGDRLESEFADVPGQWSAIWLVEGSINNTFNYTTIKNGLVGILCDGNPDAAEDKLRITNSQIYNAGSFGILGRNTSVRAENVVFNNCGQSSVAATLGGRYNFTHCTIANYWDNSFRPLPALVVNNFIVNEDESVTVADLNEANFNNCIIYGNDNPEFLLEEVEDESVAFNFKFTNCLVRFEDNNNNFTGDNYDFNNTALYENIIFNRDPRFADVDRNILTIGENSPAINAANSSFANQVPTDIVNTNRTAAPDIGAYQHIPSVDN